MKNFKFISLIFLLLVLACNKDEEILIDMPDNGDPEDIINEFIVIEYVPAPGQFINDPLSGFEDIKNQEEACSYAQSRLNGLNYVSLGAWGGYIVVKSKNPIENKGGYDFSIGGNAFDTSNEPGIVWVMEDSNKNGIPDEIWYELKGSAYNKEGYEKNFWVTYYRNDDKNDIKWIDKNGNEGTVPWVGTVHKQPNYYPSWITTGDYTLYGSKLPTKAIRLPGSGIWSNEAFEWGYADNSGEDSAIVEIGRRTIQKNFFSISDAVDNYGKAVCLETIDFIKVQTGVLNNIDILGENSTEVCGFFIEN